MPISVSLNPNLSSYFLYDSNVQKIRKTFEIGWWVLAFIANKGKISVNEQGKAEVRIFNLSYLRHTYI